MSIRVLVILGFIFLSGCVTPAPNIDLSEAGSQIKIVDYLPSEDAKNYTDVGLTVCSLGGNARSKEENIQSCKNKLKNDAAQKGGSFVVADPRNQKTVRGSANFVEMSGIIYVKKSGQKK